MYPNMFYGYFPINLIISYIRIGKPHKDHIALMLDSVKLYHIKGEELCFMESFVM